MTSQPKKAAPTSKAARTTKRPIVLKSRSAIMSIIRYHMTRSLNLYLLLVRRNKVLNKMFIGFEHGPLCTRVAASLGVWVIVGIGEPPPGGSQATPVHTQHHMPVCIAHNF
jgi:hypothetical protein